MKDYVHVQGGFQIRTADDYEPTAKAPLKIEVGGWSPRFAIANPTFYFDRPKPDLNAFAAAVIESFAEPIRNLGDSMLAIFADDAAPSNLVRILGSLTGRTSSRAPPRPRGMQIPRVDRNRIAPSLGDDIMYYSGKNRAAMKVANFGAVYGASLKGNRLVPHDVEVQSHPYGGPASITLPRELVAEWKTCFREASVWFVDSPPGGYTNAWPIRPLDQERLRLDVPFAVAHALEWLAKHDAFDPFVARALFHDWSVEALSTTLDLGGETALVGLIAEWFGGRFPNDAARAQAKWVTALIRPSDTLSLPRKR